MFGGDKPSAAQLQNRLSHRSTTLRNLLSSGLFCSGCVQLNDPSPTSIKTATSPQYFCTWGKVEEPMKMLACFEIPYRYIVKAVRIGVSDVLNKANWGASINLNGAGYVQNNWSEVNTNIFVDQFDRRILWAQITNWSHDLSRNLVFEVDYSDGSYTVLNRAGQCSKCLLLKEAGTAGTLKSQTVRCAPGSPTSPSWSEVSIDLPRKYLVKRLIGHVDSVGGLGPMDFGFNLAGGNASYEGRWMSGETLIDELPDRRVCKFRLKNWSHTDARDIAIICDYEDANYVPL